jgi:O-antigen/teichoic acid export membrane protein
MWGLVIFVLNALLNQEPRIKKLIRSFSRRPFVKNVATVATGTAASQALTIAFAPLITRLYGPEVYGLLGIFMSVTSLLAVVADLGYPTAIVLPRHDTDALGLARLSIYIGVFVAAITTIFLYIFGADLLRLLNAEAIYPFMYLIPFAVFFSVLGGILGQWLIRKRAYTIRAKYGAFTTFLLNSAKAGLGLFHPSALVLIVTNTVAGLFGTAVTYLAWRKLSRQQIAPEGPSQPSSSLRELAKRHRDFPLLRTPQDLINAFSKSLPILLLAGYFGSGAAGQYSLAIAVLGMPTRLIGGSIMAVFYPRINEAIHNRENATSLIIRATAGMAVAGALPFIGIIALGGYLFGLAFGDEWRTAGQYSQWLALWLFVGFINRPSVSAIPALDLQGMLLLHEIASVILRTASLYIGFKLLQDSISAIALYSIAGVFINGLLIFIVIKVSRRARHVYE